MRSSTVLRNKNPLHSHDQHALGCRPRPRRLVPDAASTACLRRCRAAAACASASLTTSSQDSSSSRARASRNYRNAITDGTAHLRGRANHPLAAPGRPPSRHSHTKAAGHRATARFTTTLSVSDLTGRDLAREVAECSALVSRSATNWSTSIRSGPATLPSCPAQQGDDDGLLHVDEPAYRAHRSLSFAKKADALFRISIVFACSAVSFRSRRSSSSRVVEALPGLRGRGASAGLAGGAVLLHPAPQRLRTDPELASDLGHRPSRRMHEIDRVRLYSSEYRFVYLLPTWHCFLWALTSQSPRVHDHGEASAPRIVVSPSPSKNCVGSVWAAAHLEHHSSKHGVNRFVSRSPAP